MSSCGKNGSGLAMSGRGIREKDPYLDRRSGEDRRYIYCLEYFRQGRLDRRGTGERRENLERRFGFVRVSQWSSACPDYHEKAWLEGRIEL